MRAQDIKEREAEDAVQRQAVACSTERESKAAHRAARRFVCANAGIYR